MYFANIVHHRSFLFRHYGTLSIEGKGMVLSWYSSSAWGKCMLEV